jgi:chromate transporter
MLSITIYFTFLKIGLLGFGGGYMMLPLFFLEVVQRYHWLNHDQMFSIIALAQTVPGTFATNTATLVGLNIGSPVYALAAALGIVSPALAISYLADKYIRPWMDAPAVQGVLKGISVVVIAIIAGTGLNMLAQAVNNFPTMLVVVIAFSLCHFRRWNVALAMIVASAVGCVMIWIS